jgi:hypothetical protein
VLRRVPTLEFVAGQPARELIGEENMITVRSRRAALLGVAIVGLTLGGYGMAGAAEPAAQVAPAAAAAPVAHMAPGKPAPKATPASRLQTTVTGAANTRSCASTSCGIVGSANPGNSVISWCFVVGQSVNGNPFWDLTYNTATGRGGFISETLLTNTSQGETCN